MAVLLRDLFLLQAVQLVLTYNFSNCNFNEISNIYAEVIYPDLDTYLNRNLFDQIQFCDSLTDCLMKIEYHTLNPIPGCPSLPQQKFALKTKVTLTTQCPGYSETQIFGALVGKTTLATELRPSNSIWKQLLPPISRDVHLKTDAEMGRRQCKSKYNNMKNKTSPESSPPPTSRPEHCNVDKAEENDLKNSLMKMIEEALEGKMKDTIKVIEEKTNKKLEENNKEIEEKNKKIKEMNKEIEDKNKKWKE
ncbi:hypothetical protein STEG23_010296 [Scotinomys teguina]